MSEVSYNVNFVPQTTSVTCWAASTAMLLNYRDGTNRTDADVCQEVGLDTGASPPALQQVASHFGFSEVAPACFTDEGWVQALQQNGPLLVQIPGNSHHSIVAAGASTQYGVYVLDPWDGVGWVTYDEFEQKYEAAAMRETDGDGNVVRWDWPYGNLFRS